jgi:hypothetical protein
MLAFFLGFVFSAIGVGYFIYGRKQVRIATSIAGALLCVYPYFVGSALWMCVIGGALMAVPFVTDF